jgi:hypothetical protein
MYKHISPPATHCSEQMVRLTSLGFRLENTHVDFETRFMQILEWKAIHAHTRVPISYTGHGNLGRWVKKTKELYHTGKLAPDRIARLEKIAFDFSRRGAAAAPKKNKKATKSNNKKNTKNTKNTKQPLPPPTQPQPPETAAVATAVGPPTAPVPFSETALPSRTS